MCEKLGPTTCELVKRPLPIGFVRGSIADNALQCRDSTIDVMKDVMRVIEEMRNHGCDETGILTRLEQRLGIIRPTE